MPLALKYGPAATFKMSTPELTKACRESKSLNLAGSAFGVPQLELLVDILKTEGECRIYGCEGVMSMLELGAYLATINK